MNVTPITNIPHVKNNNNNTGKGTNLKTRLTGTNSFLPDIYFPPAINRNQIMN